VERPITEGEIDCLSSRRCAGDVTSVTGIGFVLLSFGQPVAGGAGAAFTTAVGTDVAFADPSLFEAATRTRRVLLESAETSLYVSLLAPEMLAQLPPLSSQRRHW
jgi:hypothetical protein